MKQSKRKSIASELIFFSLPLILSGVMQQLYSWADAFIVGHAEGELQLAAIGATGSITGLLINTILGFTTGLSIMAAQSFGRKDETKIRRILTGFLPVLCAVYVLLAGFMIIFADPLLYIMDTPAEIFAFSLDYLRIVLIGIPFLACYNVFAALLRAVGNTKAAFWAVLISSGMNVALDVLFVAVLPFGVRGAAAATVLSQAAMTVFIVIFTACKYPFIMKRNGDRVFSGAVMREGVSFSVPPTIQNSVTSLGNLVLQNFMNGFGAATVLAITTAYRVDCIMLLPIVNLGAAISSMVARAKGAGDDKKIRSCFKTSVIMMIVIAVVLSLAMYLFGAKFIAMFGVSGEALKTGRQFFCDLAIFYTLFGVAMVLRSVLEGMGDVTVCSIIGIITLGTRIGLSYLLKPVFAGRTIAFAEGFAWILMLVMFSFRIFKKFRPTETAGI